MANVTEEIGRVMSTVKPIVVGAWVLALLVTGCSGGSAGGSEDQSVPQAPSRFDDAGATGTYDCTDRVVVVNGADSRIDLVGECKAIEVNGEGSEVTVESAETIFVNGGDAHVTYQGEPEVFVTGQGSTAEQG